jgi:hypothetical protein
VLAIHLNGEEDTNDGKDEINWWEDRLKEAFQQLELGKVIEKGMQDRQVHIKIPSFTHTFCRHLLPQVMTR